MKKLNTLKNKVASIQAANETKEKKCKELEKTVEKLEKERKTQEKTISEQDYKISQLTKQVQMLTEEINCLKSKTVIQVQLMLKTNSELMRKVGDELSLAIADDKRDSEVEVVRCMKATDIQPENPLLILCFGTHAVSQEIETTLKGIPVSKKTAVVVVHLRAEHALPVHPSDRIIVDKVIESLGGIYDIGFMSDSGLYKCCFNDNNITSIVNFIYRVGDKKPKLKH